jgi:hypothetical protein
LVKPRTKTPENSPFIGCAETSDLIINSPLNDLWINELKDPIIDPTNKPSGSPPPQITYVKNNIITRAQY